MFRGKYHQHGGFSMAMLVSRRVTAGKPPGDTSPQNEASEEIFRR